jgi:large subunit ribosomal protein L29
MKTSELRDQSRDELERQLANLRRELFDLRFQWQAEESPDTSRKGKIKKDIARILTVLREREVEEVA